MKKENALALLSHDPLVKIHRRELCLGSVSCFLGGLCLGLLLSPRKTIVYTDRLPRQLSRGPGHPSLRPKG